MQALGSAQINQADLVRRYAECGASRATLFRWIGAAINSGKPAQAVTRKVRAPASKPDETPQIAAPGGPQIVATLPLRLSLDDTLTPNRGLRVFDRLAATVADVELVQQHAKTDDGKVRNARLLLLSAARMLTCLEVSVKMVQAMHAVDRVDQFHAIIMDEIAKESPRCAAAILARVGEVSKQWGG